MESPWSKKVKVAKGEDWRRANPDVTGISDGELCQRDHVSPGYTRSQIRKTPPDTFGKVQKLLAAVPRPDTRHQHKNQKTAAADINLLQTAICQRVKTRQDQSECTKVQKRVKCRSGNQRKQTNNNPKQYDNYTQDSEKKGTVSW